MGRRGERALEGHFPRHLRKRAGEKKIKREDGGGGTKFLTFAAGGGGEWEREINCAKGGGMRVAVERGGWWV